MVEDDAGGTDRPAESTGHHRADKRHRRARLILVAFVALVIAGATATFLSRASTGSSARTVTVYPSIGAASPNYVSVLVSIGEISPAQGTQSIRLIAVPHGSYASDPDTLAVPLDLEVDGVANGNVSFLAGQSPEAVESSLELVGDVSQYPLDSYTSRLSVQMLRPGATPTPAGTASGATPVAATAPTAPTAPPVPSGQQRLANVVPIRLTVVTYEGDWRISSSLVATSDDGTVAVDLSLHRGLVNQAIALFELFIMLAISGIAIAISYTAIVGHRKLDFGLFGWLGAMLFALPAIRNAMPGIPGVGTVSDYVVYFWAIFVIGACLFTIATTYVVRTIRDKESID
jgi:hypothetical protein